MDSADTDLKKTFDIKQMALINKIHNMHWLQSNSQLSGHAKTLPGGKEIINHTFNSKINEGTKEKTEVVSTNTLSDTPELDKIDSILNKDINENNNSISKDTLQSSSKIIDFPQQDMETVWNKDVNVTNAMFPNSQSLVMQRLDKQEMIGMSLTENVVTVQLEQFRINEEENNKSDELHNEVDNEWDNGQHNISNLPKSNSEVGNQVSSKQCHDNNNNNERSKSQSPLETKKSIQKTTTKISTKKLNDQKVKKQAGSSLKESWIPSKQGSKSKDDLLNLCNDNNLTSTSLDSKKVAVGTTPKLIDKYSKVNNYNKNLIMGKGTRMKEQQFFKQHFSTFNDNGNRSRSSTEGLDEKSKSVATKLKPTRTESDKKSNEVDDIKKCHKVQVMHTQSYNVQYNRNKSVIKSHQRYSRNATKTEENSCITNPSGFNDSINVSNSTENISQKKCENQQSLINKQISNTQSSQSTSGKNTKNSIVTECSMNEKNSVRIKSSSVSCKRSYQNLSNTKNNTERNIKDDQTYAQKFKKDSNVYRRSSGILQTCFKDINGRAKTDDQKRNITENNLTKDYRINRISSVDTKMRSQSEGSKITVYSHKTSNGASNIKTDTLDSTAVNNVQSIKSLNSFSSSTKDCTIIHTSTHTPQESQISQASCNETEVQFVKTEQEDTSNNNSNNKTTSNSETKSVKFLDNIQEFNMPHHSATSYSDNSIHQNKLPANAFYSDLQNVSHTSNTQQIENYQNVQNKSYFDNNNAQYNNTTTSNQNTERDLHLMDLVQQKSEQTSHASPHSILQHNSSPVIGMGNGLPYQNMPGVYLNQYNNAQTIPRKTADSTIISQNALIPSTSSYTVENQNILQTDPSNILMHTTQTSVLPPPGFHNHPITTQHNQWNLPPQDMFLFGNVMNPAHSLNIPIQNSRHMCNADFNNIQQTSYVQQPLFYVPPLCMQSWNPMVQYPAPLFQNSPYSNCNTFPNQVLPANSLTNSMNCPVSTSMQNNLYKHFQQMQPLENASSFSVPVKLDNYMGTMQGSKTNNRMKDNTMDVHMRASQYRAPVPNEYQNCSQDSQLMVPFSYPVTMDPIARNGSSNMHMQMNHKYAPRALNSGYQRIPETGHVFHNNQDCNNRNDDVSKNDSECIPPMVSPRECMYYGVSYPRKTNTIQNSTVRSDVKPVTYNMHSVNTQHYVPHFQKNTAYHGSQKELSSRLNMGRSVRKMMDQ